MLDPRELLVIALKATKQAGSMASGALEAKAIADNAKAWDKSRASFSDAYAAKVLRLQSESSLARGGVNGALRQAQVAVEMASEALTEGQALALTRKASTAISKALALDGSARAASRAAARHAALAAECLTHALEVHDKI